MTELFDRDRSHPAGAVCQAEELRKQLRFGELGVEALAAAAHAVLQQLHAEQKELGWKGGPGKFTSSKR